MNILGISFSGTHESAACLVQDDRLVFACAEERLSRRKLDGSFPVRAIGAALKHANLTFDQIDHVAFNWPRPLKVRAQEARLLLRGTWPRSLSRIERLAVSTLGDLRHKGGQTELIRAFGQPRARIHFINHHLAHALSAYAMAPFDDAAVLVVDGRGAREATTIWEPRAGGLACVEEYEYPNSLGVFYAAITQALGFQPLSDEWKVMGLAAYGTPSVDLSPVISVHETGYAVDARYLFGRTDDDQSRLARVTGPIRSPDGEITQHHKNVASSAQLACERAMTALLRRTVAKTGRRRVCLAGGVALNCKANGELLRSGLVDELYIQPAAGDDGGCVGAAYAVSQSLSGKPPRVPLGHTYLGPSSHDDQIRATLDAFRLPYRRAANVARETAALLADDALVGWFQGRAEFGPRALGNRSILANPRHAHNLVRVNEAVKFRETWRPFAPSVLHERGAEYFHDYRAGPYMIVSFWATEKAKAEIPAVIHVDGSARVQTVTRESNPGYYKLIEEFGRQTGVWVLLNTSFNLKGDAIVTTPAEAIETFYTSGLDHLVLGNFILSKSTSTARAPQRAAADAPELTVA